MDDHSPELTRFPPLITPFRLREREDAFAAAIRSASAIGDQACGAGSLFYVGRFELIELAIVLEPEEPLRLARKIFYAGMNALADALAVLSPPEKPITIRYPGSLYFDSALVGGGRLAAPEGVSDGETPPWLVFGAMVRAGGTRHHENSLVPEITSLDEEGFEAWNPADFSASFARHFMVGVDAWGEGGMRRIGPEYLARLEKGANETRRGIDENGDLLVHENGREAARRVSFVSALRHAEWYDASQNEPRS